VADAISDWQRHNSKVTIKILMGFANFTEKHHEQE
jgi:hypothetical protein